VVRVVSVLDKEHKVQVDDVHKNETVVETWRIWCKIILDEAFPQTHEMDEVRKCMRCDVNERHDVNKRHDVNERDDYNKRHDVNVNDNLNEIGTNVNINDNLNEIEE
jgi:hypothetical protein